MRKGLKITQALDYVNAERKLFYIIHVISLKSFTHKTLYILNRILNYMDFDNFTKS